MRYLIALVFLLAAALASADTTFTYQGQLQDGSGPFSGQPEMEFRLYDSLAGTTQVGGTVVHGAVPVTDGLFRIELDFGRVFDGTGLFLEVSVEGQPLSPRQAITAAPMAQFAMTPAGPEGPVGPQGPQGAQGPEGASPFELIGDDAVYLQGNVGIGTSSPSVALAVVGSAKFGHASNQASGELSFVGGGTGNSATGSYSFIGSGFESTASGIESFVGGGFRNAASGIRSFVGAGENNIASSLYSVVGGGVANVAEGPRSFIGSGTENATGGTNSFAAGRRAKAEHNGTFVWGDHRAADFASSGENQFLIRALGGMGVGTNAPARDLHIKQRSSSNSEIGLQIERSGTSGNNWAFYVAGTNRLGFRYNDNLVARIDTSGEFATLSDASYKTGIKPLAGALERIMRLEPASYRMTMGSEDDPVSLGLIAQQVSQVLPGAVSEEEETLGVYYNQITALNTAALIELNARTLASSEKQRTAIEAQQAIIQTQQARIAELEKQQDTQMAKLQARLASLEALLLAEERQLVEQNR